MEDQYREEAVSLERLAARVRIGLMFWVIVSGALALVLVMSPKTFGDPLVRWGVPGELWLPSLCVAAAALGSSVSMLVSVTERIAEGWEFSNGEKWPKKPGDADSSPRFGGRFATWYPVRPLLGGALGLVVYLGVSAGGLAMSTQISSIDGAKWAFVAFLGGFSAKSLLERLRAAVDTIFGGTK